MSTSTATNEINQLTDALAKSFALGIWEAIKMIWLGFWPYITLFIVIIIAGVILQILMLRSGRRNRLPRGFNRLVGSLTYFLFFGLIFVIAYWVFGARIVDELWLAIFGAIAFPATGLFLRAIGFWYY